MSARGGIVLALGLALAGCGILGAGHRCPPGPPPNVVELSALGNDATAEWQASCERSCPPANASERAPRCRLEIRASDFQCRRGKVWWRITPALEIPRSVRAACARACPGGFDRCTLDDGENGTKLTCFPSPRC